MNILSVFHMIVTLIFLTVAVIILGRAGFFAGANSCSQMDPGTEQDGCFIDLAIKEKDVSHCAKVSDDDAKYPCYSAVAVLKRDRSVCDELPEERRVQCDMFFQSAVR